MFHNLKVMEHLFFIDNFLFFDIIVYNKKGFLVMVNVIPQDAKRLRVIPRDKRNYTEMIATKTQRGWIGKDERGEDWFLPVNFLGKVILSI